MQQRSLHNQGQHQTTIIPNGTNGTQFHKLLVSGASTPVTPSSAAPELARLPGGAELNILPAGTNGATLYRGNGKLAIVNNGMTIKGTSFLYFIIHNFYVINQIDGFHCPLQ